MKILGPSGTEHEATPSVEGPWPWDDHTAGCIERKRWRWVSEFAASQASWWNMLGQPESAKPWQALYEDCVRFWQGRNGSWDEDERIQQEAEKKRLAEAAAKGRE